MVGNGQKICLVDSLHYIMAAVAVIMLRITVIYVIITKVVALVDLMQPSLAQDLLMLMRCLGIVYMAIHVGMQMSYGLLWATYIKVVCGLKRSLC